MLASADVIAFVPTTDLDRARGFYEGVLGLPVTEDDGLALALNAHGTMLRVTTVRELTPSPTPCWAGRSPASPRSTISQRAV